MFVFLISLITCIYTYKVLVLRIASLHSLPVRRRVSSVVEHSSANPKVPGSIWARSHTDVMNYGEACFMHLIPGVVHNFPKAVGV